jgi:rod shape-determining protein MreD
MTLVAVAAVLVQTVMLPKFAVLGWQPDLVLLTVIGFALASGPRTGARYGFAAGLLVDLVSGAGQPVGLSSLVMLSAGWVTGEARPHLTASRISGRIAAGGVVTAAALSLQALIEMLLHRGHYAPGGLLAGVLVTGLYNAVLAPVVCAPLAQLAARLTADPLAS